MKRVHILLMALVALSIQSCQNDLNMPAPASRSYEQDAEVLNKFVDINKTTHEYYINPDKRTTALSYITNADAEELSAVNPLNLDMFEQSINRISKLSGQFTSNNGVDYVVMITNNEIYVNRIKSDSPIVLERIYETETIRSYYPKTTSLKVTGNKEEYTVYRNGDIETSVELAPQTYKNAGWAFFVSCEMKENDNKQIVNVLFCGVGRRMITPRFMWHADQPDTEWRFEVASSCDSSDPNIAKFNISHQW